MNLNLFKDLKLQNIKDVYPGGNLKFHSTELVWFKSGYFSIPLLHINPSFTFPGCCGLYLWHSFKVQQTLGWTKIHFEEFFREVHTNFIKPVIAVVAEADDIHSEMQEWYKFLKTKGEVISTTRNPNYHEPHKIEMIKIMPTKPESSIWRENESNYRS